MYEISLAVSLSLCPESKKLENDPRAQVNLRIKYLLYTYWCHQMTQHPVTDIINTEKRDESFYRVPLELASSLSAKLIKFDN